MISPHITAAGGLFAALLLGSSRALRVESGNPELMGMYEAPKSRQMQSFILTSKPFIAIDDEKEESDGSDEYFVGSKKPVWDDLDNHYVLDCAPGRKCSHVIDFDEVIDGTGDLYSDTNYFKDLVQQADYLTNEIKEKFDYYGNSNGKESAEEDAYGDRWMDRKYSYDTTTIPTTTTTTTTTPKTMYDLKYSIKDEKNWWQKKKQPSERDKWKNEDMRNNKKYWKHKRRTTVRPRTTERPNYAWEGHYENSRLPASAHDIDRYDFTSQAEATDHFYQHPQYPSNNALQERPTSWPHRVTTTTAMPPTTGGGAAYDPFSYHANNKRKSKMRTEFRDSRNGVRGYDDDDLELSGSSRYSHRSDSRMSVPLPEYRRRPEPVEQVPQQQRYFPAASERYDPYYYYNGYYTDEPWRVKVNTYNDRYGWQQTRPNRRRTNNEVPVWTSIDLEKPKWSQRR
jgi:hypothetical protein